jgi:hypothetical protein
MSTFWQQLRERCRPGRARLAAWQPPAELREAQAGLTQRQARLAALRDAPPAPDPAEHDAASGTAGPAANEQEGRTHGSDA